MANILFLAHRIPYPPNKGDKIRSWNFLSRLAEQHIVHAAFFVDDDRDLKHIPFLEEKVSSLCYEKVSPLFQKITSLSGFITGKSLTESAYPYGRLRAFCSKLLSGGDIDVIFLFSAAVAPLVLSSQSTRIVADLVDVDSEKWKSYSQTSFWPMSWVYAREAQKLAAFEADVAARAEATILVSEDEARLFRDLNPDLNHKVFSVSNGVDTDIFDPGKYTTAPVPKGIIFTGAMDYQPNVEAVEWFCHAVWPLLRAKHADAQFMIAGGPLTARTRKLEAYDGVSVVGYVPDMAEVISASCIAVAPLRTARGIQNKVLEALSMAKPVVATSLANEGINAEAGRDLMVADTPEQFAGALDELLCNGRKCAALGRAGRAFVTDQFSWNKSYQALNNLILGH